MRLDARSVVITGASSGIGRALVQEVARRGARVVMIARGRERLEAIATSLRRAGKSVYTVGCDVADPAAARDMIYEARGVLGRIDILINNAGISVYGLAEYTADREFERLLAVNLMGPWYTTSAVLPLMREQDGGGMIVNVSSVAALYGPPYLAAYAATKAALAAMTQGLRAELAGTGIRLMVAYPGYTRTDLFARERQVGGGRRPRTTYGAPERVARAIVRGIERERRELVLSPEGHGLSLLRRICPGVLDKVMHRVALRLAQPM